MTQADVTSLSLDRIVVGERLRQVDEAHAEAIAASMSEVGLMQAIEVRPTSDALTYTLVAGAHRLAAARSLGWADIPVSVVEIDDAEARLREIDENLFRRELSPFDRATFLAERKALYEELHPEAKAGGDRKSDQSVRFTVWSFARATAERTGLSERAVQRAVSIMTRLDPAVRARIAVSWLAEKEGQLYALTRYAPKDQARLTDLLLAETDPAKTVKEAEARLRGVAAAPAPDEKQLKKLLDAWNRASMSARRRFVDAAGDDLAALLADLDEAA